MSQAVDPSKQPTTGHVPENPAVIAVIGNPNTGKSTLFNALTGLRQKVANYPGVTVERRTGELITDQGRFLLVDLPGTYSLAAHSPDELIAVEVLLGRIADLPRPKAVLVVVDASNLSRNLFLATQVMELGVPVVVALNMCDVANAKDIQVHSDELARRLGTHVVPMVASRGEGLNELKHALSEAIQTPSPVAEPCVPELKTTAREIARTLAGAGDNVSAYEVERALIDEGGFAEKHLVEQFGANLTDRLIQARHELAGDQSLAALDARKRYQRIAEYLRDVEIRGEDKVTWSDHIDRVVSQPLVGTLLFVAVMGAVFQAVFSWATPLMDLIDAATAIASHAAGTVLPEGALASLVTDGVISGVGSVVIFLPQILILFAFIILLEDTGYMARAAFLMDRLMRWCGLSGHSFLPMLSSFACAVPGIMGTRVIPDTRDRIATILAAPFMTCSARLPVYALLIAAFVPQERFVFGLINLQGLVLLGLYLLGIAGGVTTAFLLKRTLLRGPTPTFLMELPPYRIPNLRSVLLRLMERGRAFLVRAGSVIFVVTLVVWALAYFPRAEVIEEQFAQRQAEVEALEIAAESKSARLVQLENELAAAQMEQSYLGRIGKTLAPIFHPLGWDWKLSAAVVASFPAREVVVAVLGTTYAVGGDVEAEDEGLRDRIRSATWPDGTLVFTLPVALGLMVFYAFCLQCAATVATIRRETNSWRWPVFAWTYMTTLGYLGALVCVQLGQALS
ncbi:MAG: ferrous iron transport protein B [Pseudomonadota bacterium]|nr:ferrous iron transport protein B [Pseudomonadota bacterium]